MLRTIVYYNRGVDRETSIGIVNGTVIGTV